MQDGDRYPNPGAGPKRGRSKSAASRDASSAALSDLVGLLDRAVKVVPAAGYFWGVIAASVTVAVISLLNGLNRLTFVAMLAAFVAMVLFYVFSRFEKSTDAVVRLVGHALLIVTGLAFIFVIASSAWLAVSCTGANSSVWSPRLIAYIYGFAEVCYGKSADTPAEKKTAFYRSFVRREGLWEGVDQIAADDASHLSRSFEFISVGDTARPIEVRATNGSGFCASDGFLSPTGDASTRDCSSARACTAKFKYRQDGTVEREALYDQFDNQLEEMHYPSTSVGEFVDSVFPCDHGRSGIRLIQFDRMKSGPNKGLDEVIRLLDKDRTEVDPDRETAGAVS
jgi:hypothetical protein